MDKQQRKSKPKVNKTDALPVRLIKKKREKPNNQQYPDHNRCITTEPKDVIRECCAQLSGNMATWSIPEIRMNKFTEKHNIKTKNKRKFELSYIFF